MNRSDVPPTDQRSYGPPETPRMGFTAAVRSCFRRYVTFSGRASRPEYWWFVLFLFLGSFVASLLDGILFGAASVQTGPGRVAAESNGPLNTIFGLVTLLPLVAAGWRRMHDTGRNGLYLLYPFIAMIGTISFAAMTGGSLEAVADGRLGGLFTGLTGIVLAIAFVVCLISPLIVIWWLTRPTQPVPNQWGAAPRGPA